MIRKPAKTIYGDDFLDSRPRLFCPSGCKLLDLVMGGSGFPLGRITNIVGGYSSGKTLICIEACTNFASKFPNGEIYYRESEAAFDLPYAKSLGTPVDRINFKGLDTVEAWFDDILAIIGKGKRESPILYVMDSLDGLTNYGEQDTDFSKGSYGASKARKLSELFRRIVRDLHRSNTGLIIVSQIRDKLNVIFGEKESRSGGKALDFYASIVLHVRELRKRPKTIKGVTRAVGIDIKVTCKKNKVGIPFRDCRIPILFNYGMESGLAALDWLVDNKKITSLDHKSFLKGYHHDHDYIRVIERRLTKEWLAIEDSFKPKRSKY